MLAPGLVRDEAVQLAQELETTLQSLHETGATDMPTVAHIGLAPYNPGDASADLLTLFFRQPIPGETSECVCTFLKLCLLL